MTTPITVRPANIPDDFASMAAVITAEHNGDWPVSASDLAAEYAARDPRFVHLALLAEIDGQAVGVGTAGHIPYAHREGRFGLDLRVRPEYQGQGAGKALYDALMLLLAPHHPAELVTEVWETLPRPNRFVTDRGFTPTWRRADYTIDVAHFDLSPYAHYPARLQELGVEIIPYAALASDPERHRKLHALDWVLLQDIPFGETQTQIPLEQFVGETLNAPGFLPEACFIAIHNGEWIGYSNLLQGENYFATQMTGVLPAWRGKGIATALKLAGIDYAQAHGNFEIRTTNDPGNDPMLAINRRLGFKEVGALVRYKKELPLTAPPNTPLHPPR